MNKKEKAKELVNKYWNMNITTSYINEGIITVDTIGHHLHLKDAKQCALIAVDEIIKYGAQEIEMNYSQKCFIEYWQGVKEEIKQL